MDQDQDYELFKQKILSMTGIDLSCYKEKQMRRRIESLISRHSLNGFSPFVDLLKKDEKVFEEFISYLTINVSEFYK